jgi:hypothetical protein
MISIWLCEYVSQLMMQEGGEDGTVYVYVRQWNMYILYKLHNNLNSTVTVCLHSKSLEKGIIRTTTYPFIINLHEKVFEVKKQSIKISCCHVYCTNMWWHRELEL